MLPKEAELRSPGPLPAPSQGVPFPRLESTYTADGTYADLVCDWSEKHLSRSLYEWQQHYLSGVLAYRGARLIHRRGLVSTARQNGKSTAAMALLGWYLTESEDVLGALPLAVLITHHLNLTKELFDPLVGVLGDNGYVKKVIGSYGRQELILNNKARLLIQADSANAGHGLAHVGLIYADEMWHLHPDALEHGLIPTTRTHPQPIILCTSTAGDETSELLRSWRERGIRAVDTGEESSFYFAEWSPPSGIDPMDERWWGYANPALGQGFPIEVLREDAQAPNRNAFLRSCLNLWVAADQSWIAPGTWERLEVPDLGHPRAGVLVCEVGADGSRWVGVRAWLDDKGVAGVRTAFVEDSEHEMWRRIEEAMRLDPMLQLGLTPSLEYHCPEPLRRRTKVIGYTELARWTVGVRSLMDQRQVAHEHDYLLAEHVNRAVLNNTEVGRAISTKKSPGPIELAQCMVWAVAMVKKPAVSGKPSMGRAH